MPVTQDTRFHYSVEQRRELSWTLIFVDFGDIFVYRLKHTKLLTIYFAKTDKNLEL